MVAKTDAALRALSGQLKSRTLGRTYLALVEGHLPFDEGTIDAAIGRHQAHRKVMAVRYLGGRQAVTRYRVLKRMGGQGVGGGKTGRGGRGSGNETSVSFPYPPTLPPVFITPHPSPLPFRYTALEVNLQTGRTHQIRVHLAHLGHPVLGDLAYGRHPAAFWEALGIRRQLLHAWRLRLQHPTTGQSLKFDTQVPSDMAYLLAK